jgi:hypothetical protein
MLCVVQEPHLSGRAAMGTATPGAILGLLTVFLILAILPLILIRRDSLEEKVNQKEPSDFRIDIKKHYDVLSEVSQDMECMESQERESRR